MVGELREVLALVEQQTDEVQRQTAELVSLALEEREWDATVSTPESQAFLVELVAEAHADIARGDMEDGGWDR
jgi:F0F1-type ATP synthase membrane subunit b/b'